MKDPTSRQKILCGVRAMLFVIVGDYLLGFGTIGTTHDPDAYPGLSRKERIPEQNRSDGFSCISPARWS